MKKLSILLLAGLGGSAHANAFLLNEFDAKQVGRGNASTATDVDPSSIYYNIGGLAVGEGTNVQIGGSFISANASFTDLSGSKTDTQSGVQPVPGIFASTRIHPMVAVGIGFYTPFGLAIDWPTTSPQADVNLDTVLHTFFITPSVGVNLGSIVPGLSAGAGIDLVPATVELKQEVFFGSDTGMAHLAANAFGVGGRVGVMYRPTAEPRLSLGAMWRSDVKEDFSGNGDFDAPAPYRSQLPPDGAVKTSITLPQQVSGGVAFRVLPTLEIEGNVVWTNWSKFKSLDVQVPASTTGDTMTISTVEDYSNKTTLRLGAEYGMPNLGLALRAGYIYDPTPIPTNHLTAQLPDINRNDVTIGASKTAGNYAVHLGLLWVLPGSRQTAMSDPYQPQAKGTYDVNAFVASVTLQGHFDH
jgi:long-chain fatty acid transport protein